MPHAKTKRFVQKYFKMKERVISYLSRFHYPQIIFAKEIEKVMNEFGLDVKTVLDAPCGNGETSYYLSGNSNLFVTGADIDGNSIKVANKNFKSKNLSFVEANIFDLLQEKQIFDTICIINSLFLLPDKEKLFDLVRKNLKSMNSLFFLVIPNIESKNYKLFMQSNPGFKNQEIEKQEMVNILGQNNFTVKVCKEIVYINHYGRMEMKFLSIFYSLYLNLLNTIVSMKRKKKGNYILLACTKVS